METADLLLAIERIKQLKARYFRHLDTKDWNSLRGVFSEHASFDIRAAFLVGGAAEGEPAPEGEAQIAHGASDVVDLIRGAVGTRRTVHHGHCHEIDVVSPDDARGVLSMEDLVMNESGDAVWVHGWGHYHETYRREGGVWRIWKSRLTRLHLIVA